MSDKNVFSSPTRIEGKGPDGQGVVLLAAGEEIPMSEAIARGFVKKSTAKKAVEAVGKRAGAAAKKPARSKAAAENRAHGPDSDR